jgi:hypothetical protein
MRRHMACSISHGQVSVPELYLTLVVIMNAPNSL